MPLRANSRTRAVALDDQAITIVLDFHETSPAQPELGCRASGYMVQTQLYACRINRRWPKCESAPAPRARSASYLAMYGAATMAVPNAAIARPSASAKAVRSSRILFEGRGIRVSDNLGRIIPEMIVCSDGVSRSTQATPVVWYTFVLNELDAKKARGGE